MELTETLPDSWSKSLHGRAVLVHGASRGIGEETARLFAAAGARVMLTARNGDAIRRIADEIGGVAQVCDVARREDVDASIAACQEKLGGLDVMINNAAVIEPIGRLADTDPEAWSRLIDINVKGVYYALHAALPVMKPGGTIITLSSGAAHGWMEGWSGYCTSKAAAAMLMRVADLEYASSGLRIMGLSPGTVATRMQEEIKASGINRVSQLEVSDHVPPDWPARAMLWMCTPEADDYVGGEVRLRDPEVRRAAGLAG